MQLSAEVIAVVLTALAVFVAFLRYKSSWNQNREANKTALAKARRQLATVCSEMIEEIRCIYADYEKIIMRVDPEGKYQGIAAQREGLLKFRVARIAELEKILATAHKRGRSPSDVEDLISELEIKRQNLKNESRSLIKRENSVQMVGFDIGDEDYVGMLIVPRGEETPHFFRLRKGPTSAENAP